MNSSYTVKEVIPHEPQPTVLPLVFHIVGMCDKVLEVIYTQGKAIKVYICEYRGKVTDARLVMIKNGIRYTVQPSGSPADYQ